MLQLDPNSGAILRKIEVGNQPHRLVLARNRGLWVGLNGEGKIRRIDLIDFSVGQKFELGLAATTPIRDIAPSHVDEDTFAFSAGGRTSLVKDGVLLPDSVVMGSPDNITTPNGITMLGNYVYGSQRARMTATGLVVDGAFPVRPGELESLNGRIFMVGGIIDPEAGTAVEYILPVFPWWPHTFSLAEGTSYLWLSWLGTGGGGSGDWGIQISRFTRETGKLTGHFQFSVPQPGPGPGPWQVAAIGTNRAAVVLGQGSKLYLVDLGRAFQPGTLEVTATFESPRPGKMTEQRITVANTGPGFLTSVRVTNRVSSNAFLTFPATHAIPGYQGHVGKHEMRLLKPGEAHVLTVYLTALNTTVVTNILSWHAELNSDPDNLGRETLLPVEDTFKRSTMQLAILGTNATALAYDPVTDRMFQGDTTGRLWEVDFKNMNLRLVNHWQLTQGIRDTRVVLENRGLWVTVAGWDLVTRLDLDTLAIGPAIPTMTTVRDLAGSPTQPGLVAYASPDRVGVAGGGSPQGSNWVQGSGEIEFSSDGTKIYQLADLDCSLRILNLTATNLSRGATYHDMPCDSFQHSDGWLYFNNGLVFDPDKGQTVTNLNLRSPAFMLPDSSDRLHILTKTNGRWVVRTLNKKTFTELNRFDLPLEFSNYTFRKGTAMGTAKVGVVAASGEVIVVNLQSGELRLGAERINGQVELAFATVAGERYQLQESATIASPQWQNVGVEIVGTGSVEKRAFTTAGIEKYYRLVRLP